MNTLKICENGEIDVLLKEFLNMTLKELMAMLSCECGSLFLFDSKKDELVLNSFYNSSEKQLHGLRQRIGEGILGKIVNMRMPVLVKNIDNDIRFKRNGFRHYQTNSFISIPLSGVRGLLGIINLADKSNGEPFSEKELEFSSTLCRYAYTIVENILRSSQLKQEKEFINKQKTILEKYANVGKLAAGLVHEINNPLDGVIRYTNMLLEQADTNSVSREYLIEIKKGLNRIGNITKSLLEFSYQVNSNTAQVKQLVNINRLIDDSLDVFSNRLNAGGIQVRKKYNPDLPLILDLGLQHVFVNLIKNALDAMPQDGELEICTDIKEDVFEIIFIDTGLGIPGEIKEHIFEPFFTTKSIEKGTGLGLSICREIISRYDGKIDIHSAPGKGAKFTILIPAKFSRNE